MEKTIRQAMVVILLVAFFLLLFCIPPESHPLGQWIAELAVTKTLALAAYWAAMRVQSTIDKDYAVKD